MSVWFARFYVLVLSGMAVYGCLGLVTLFFYWRHRNDSFPTPKVREAELPTVTVQLPIYNEQFVLERLVTAACSLDYPIDKLEIQIVDDSTDQTTSAAQSLVERFQEQGLNIQLIHRTNRVGYKAGALEEALADATGEFVAVFDADFSPEPHFLRQTIPHFIDEPELGMIQARWGHLNVKDSALTRAQAIALDKHFAMEQTVRHRADMFPKFNGSGGIWRRSCIEAVGGWQADTVCEDLCLSTRAILDGWQFRFLADVTAPAELPNTIAAYKNQQARWAKGSLQCLIKFFWSIVTSKQHRLVARIYAVLAMSGYFANGLLLTLLLLQVPMMLLQVQLSPLLILFSIAGIGQPVLFVLAQQVLYSDWKERLRYFPAMLVIAVGLTPSQCRAMFEVFFGRILKLDHPFIRTPKGIGQRTAYKLPFDWIIVVEFLLAIYAGYGLFLAIQRGQFTSLFLLTLCLLGFSYVGFLGLTEWMGIGKKTTRIS